jgi:hypothetical protein
VISGRASLELKGQTRLPRRRQRSTAAIVFNKRLLQIIVRRRRWPTKQHVFLNLPSKALPQASTGGRLRRARSAPLASGLGGYLAGRLREKWVGIRTDEVLFRDTAHGFLAWALATLIVVTLLTIGSLTVAAAAPATTGGPVSPEAAEAARKAAAAFAFYSSLSLLIGAFIASVAGGLGGFHRDEV